jgi:hypothetical protein
VEGLVPVIDFERTLAEAAHFTSSHGRFPGTHTDDPHELRLGQWLVKRRLRYNDGTLPAARAEQLDSTLGPEWRPKFKSDAVCLATKVPNSSMQNVDAIVCTVARALASSFVVAEMSVRPPRKIFIFIIWIKCFLDQSIQQNIFIDFWKREHWLWPPTLDPESVIIL